MPKTTVHGGASDGGEWVENVVTEPTVVIESGNPELDAQLKEAVLKRLEKEAESSAGKTSSTRTDSESDTAEKSDNA